MLQPLQGKRKWGGTIGTDHNSTDDDTKKIKTEMVQPKAEEIVQAAAILPKAEQAQTPGRGGGHGAKEASNPLQQQQRELLFKQASAIVRLDNSFLNDQNAKAQAAGSLYERVYMNQIMSVDHILTVLYRIRMCTFTNIGNCETSMQHHKR